MKTKWERGNKGKIAREAGIGSSYLCDIMRMRKIIFALPALLCMLSCSQDSPLVFDGQRVVYEARISDWQHRECAGVEPIFNASGYVDEYEAVRVVRAVRREIQYDSDKLVAKDWRLQTSAETQATGKGICGDLAVLAYMRLRALGFDDGRLL